MLDETLIKKLLKTSIFGQYLYILPEIESTNSYALELVNKGAPEGTVIITDFQRNGKGRLGRIWESSSAVNILMSLILRPQINIEAAHLITLATANILISSMENFLRREKAVEIEFNVKWPNDILVGGKKIAGILCESGVREKSVEYIVVGIGVNINQDISKLSKEIRERTTSFYAETSKIYQRERLISQILLEYEDNYIRLQRAGYVGVVEDWKKHCDQLGTIIVVDTVLGSERGSFADVDEKGVLLYKTEAGEIKKLVAGSIKYENASHGING
jgi:BirA family biotin operon repressor/biotin-[acetyl-CoA-carboxylase] ligase